MWTYVFYQITGINNRQIECIDYVNRLFRRSTENSV